MALTHASEMLCFVLLVEVSLSFNASVMSGLLAQSGLVSAECMASVMHTLDHIGARPASFSMPPMMGPGSDFARSVHRSQMS